MDIIEAISEITMNREKAKEITDKVIERANKEGELWGNILREELEKEKLLRTPASIQSSKYKYSS